MRLSQPNFSRRWPVLFLLLTLLGSALILAGRGAAAGAQNVVVTMATREWERVEGVTPVHLLDYGPFVWLELTPDSFDQLQATGLRYDARPDAFTLTLGEQSFDTRIAEPRLPAGLDKVRSDGPDLHLVQLLGPTRDEWLRTLEGQGLEIVQYIYPYTYVVWGEMSDSLVDDTDFVRWTGPFAPAYRLLPNYRGLAAAPLRADVLFYRGADIAAADAAIRALGAAPAGGGILNDTWAIAGYTALGNQLAAIARIPGVYSVQPVPLDGGLRGEMSNQINVGGYDETNLAYPGYEAWLASVGVNGSGVIIANVDGGVQDSHPDLTNRMVSCTGSTCSGTSSGHGTHTAGIMAADGSSGVTTTDGFLRGLGMAPGANLIEQVYSPTYTFPNGMLTLMYQSYANGALLSGNSWGPAGTPRGYDDDTMQVDIGVRDASPDDPGNQEFTFVLSFMNGNGGTSSQGTPDEAKNLFNIGSTKMQTSATNQILQIDDLSANTAHGPALDGRTIPHMVAPGCSVDSTYTGSGYTLLCGTSMASPHVSGAVALFIEYYRNVVGADPSPALVKAAFLPVAHDLAGHKDADNGTLGHPFDSKQGWGRMNVTPVVSPTLPVLYYDAPQIFDMTGDQWVLPVMPFDPSEPMRIMLVWTDAPGHGLGGSTPAWNNNLDLIVSVGANTYYGNDFGDDGWSAADGSADERNNTEGVFLGPTAPGLATITVLAANIDSDGIPGSGDETDQDFAIVCYNCATDLMSFFLPAVMTE